MCAVCDLAMCAISTWYNQLIVCSRTRTVEQWGITISSAVYTCAIAEGVAGRGTVHLSGVCSCVTVYSAPQSAVHHSPLYCTLCAALQRAVYAAVVIVLWHVHTAHEGSTAAAAAPFSLGQASTLR